MLIFCHVDVPYFAGSIAQCLCDLVYCIFSSCFNEVFYLSKKKKMKFFCFYMCSFGRMVACFRYASIDVHSVYLPPQKLEFFYDNQEWIKTEVNEVQ